MILSAYTVQISARMLVREATQQADEAEKILCATVARINAEFHAISAALAPILEEEPV